MRIATTILGAFVLAAVIGPHSARAQSDGDVERVVARNIAEIVPANGPSGAAVALRINGRTLFYNHGLANAESHRPITSDSIFNLASVGKLFATTLLAQAVMQGEMNLDDPVDKYVTELQKGGDIRDVTVGQIASHTSGLPREPGQYETWHRGTYAFSDFVRFLNEWQADPQHEPGKQDIYSNLAMVLLRVVLEGRFKMPFAALMKQRLTGPLGMSATDIPLPAALRGRAVQGYGPLGRPIGQPGVGESTHLVFPATGQIFSSPRDMATFLVANMGELPDHQQIQHAMAFAQQGVFKVNPRFTQALAWQIVNRGDLTIIDKNGGLPNTSTYIGFAPATKTGIVVLANRGRQKATRVGRAILNELARLTGDPTEEGADPD
jgi:beta-lactamase class C